MLRTKSIALACLLTSCTTYIPREKVVTKYKELPPKVVIKEVVKVERKVSSVKNPTFDYIHDLELDYKKKHFDFWLGYFSKKERARFLRHLKNGEKYRDVVTQILESHGLPKDLFFVGLIESGYNTYIKSHASAVGPWQFIKGTAKRYGLRVDGYIDERSHIIKATHAAANYFKDLYNIFGSWELALCAYNAGEYRIINAIRKGNTRDYKKLVKLKLIPRETIFYIPKVAAARALYEQPKRYGLYIPKTKFDAFEKVRKVKLTKSFDLYKLSRKHKISLRTLKTINPDIKRRWVRVTRWRKQSVYLPSSRYTKFNLEDTPKIRSFASNKKTRSHKTYRVKKGDNLYTISRRLGINVSTLKRLNKIRGSKIFVGQKLKVKRLKKRSKVATYYKVRRGDNLSTIARKFKTSVAKLMRLNSLSKSKIFVGKRLLVKGSDKKASTYKVKRGDSLIRIAKRFGVSVTDIKEHNDLRNNIVMLGQRIKIPNEG